MDFYHGDCIHTQIKDSLQTPWGTFRLGVKVCVYVLEENGSNGNKTQMQRIGFVPTPPSINVNVRIDVILIYLF